MRRGSAVVRDISDSVRPCIVPSVLGILQCTTGFSFLEQQWPSHVYTTHVFARLCVCFSVSSPVGFVGMEYLGDKSTPAHRDTTRQFAEQNTVLLTSDSVYTRLREHCAFCIEEHLINQSTVVLRKVVLSTSVGQARQQEMVHHEKRWSICVRSYV